MKPLRIFLGLTGMLLAVSCTLPVVQQGGGTISTPAPGDQIVFLSLDGPDDASIPSCVAETVTAGRPDIKPMPSEVFRDALFPWLEASTAPHGLEAFGRLLARPPVQQRLADVHVRYVAVVSGTTTMGPARGGIGCFAGPGAGGCFGLAWFDRESRIATALWDTKASTPATLEAQVNGVWAFPAFFLPVPLLGATETPACSAMAQQILDHLLGVPAPP